jgi:putative flippase GtrA
MAINFKQIINYYAVGAFVNCSGYFIFLLLVAAGGEHKLIASILYIVGVVVSYWLNGQFVFHRSAPTSFRYFRVIMMLLGGYFINIALLYVFVDVYHVSAGKVQLISIVLVSIYFYIANKFYVHRHVN